MMSDTEFRHGKKPFHDNLKFPRGFAKSVHSTLAEEKIIVLSGDTMNGLELGQNNKELHFVKVLKQPNKTRSKLERVWLKFVR